MTNREEFFKRRIILGTIWNTDRFVAKKGVRLTKVVHSLIWNLTLNAPQQELKNPLVARARKMLPTRKPYSDWHST